MSPSPRLQVESGRVVLSGEWTLAALVPQLREVEAQLAGGRLAGLPWDLSSVSRLDSAAAVLLWRTWNESWPRDLVVSEMHRRALERAATMAPAATVAASPTSGPVVRLGYLVLALLDNLRALIILYGQMLLDLGHLVLHPSEIPWREIAANIYKAGAMALPVTALVGFLIGVTISYLSALQLRNFGADVFIVNILGISIIRELGPVLVAVLVAGRSGSAMTAQIGVMRVTEEIDALSAMGVSRSIRVVLPKLLALTAVMPLLVLWASAIALLGGMVSALLQLGIPFAYFVENLQRAVPVANLVIGLGKGLVFGFIIAWVACHFGLRVKPNTESLSANTTTSVVTAITLVILVDAVFAIMTRNMGIPQL
ncbi:ABC transporter permease [Dechloromonas sp. H13]|uniref:ABC transporter permease n=1 Tax=Dechloromonas sp. H13 TaxID=2570193 RepID=UPI001291BA45|nr:MlaE family lipid ABC transporter permease subunit [Dechloromonas sp. H13]